MPYIRNNDSQRKKLHHIENRKQTRKIQRKLKRGKKLSEHELEFLQRTHGRSNRNTQKHQRNNLKSNQRSKSKPNKHKKRSQFSRKMSNGNNRNKNKSRDEYDDPDRKLIASLEKKLGVTGNDKYWKKQEFTGDGIDLKLRMALFS